MSPTSVPPIRLLISRVLTSRGMSFFVVRVLAPFSTVGRKGGAEVGRESITSARQRAQLKACRLRGGDACPCDWSECRIYAASFGDILRLRDQEERDREQQRHQLMREGDAQGPSSHDLEVQRRVACRCDSPAS